MVLKSILKALAPLMQIGLLVMFAIVIFAIVSITTYFTKIPSSGMVGGLPRPGWGSDHTVPRLRQTRRP